MDASLVKRDPEIMRGAPCFTGIRVPVKNLFDYLEGSPSLEEFLEDFPSVSRERAVALLEAAWDIEIERRIAAYKRGKVEIFAAEDVLAEARRIAP